VNTWDIINQGSRSIETIHRYGEFCAIAAIYLFESFRMIGKDKGYRTCPGPCAVWTTPRNVVAAGQSTLRRTVW